MGLCLAFTQYQAVFPLLQVRNLMASSRDSASLNLRDKLTKLGVYAFGILVGAFGTICWFSIEILQFTKPKWTDREQGYIFSVFFFSVALLMISGTVIINYLMHNFFSHKIQERKHFLCVFITIAIIMFVQSVWLSVYYFALFIHVDDYQRYIIENMCNIVWDVPTILMVCWLHHESNSEALNISQRSLVSPPRINGRAMVTSQSLVKSGPVNQSRISEFLAEDDSDQMMLPSSNLRSGSLGG